MQSIRFLHLPVVIAAVIALCVSAPVHGAQPVTTSLQVPLEGTVFVPLNNGGLDTVLLTGYVHVETHVPAVPVDPWRILVNLDQVAGIGDITGLLYVAMGAQQITLPTTPVDPMRVEFVLRAEGLTPPDPVIPTDPFVPLDITFILTFNAATGELTDVSIDAMSVPIPE